MKQGVEEVSREICGFLRTGIIAEGVPFNEESSLNDMGVDSFSLIQILLFVERRFGVIVPEELLTPENMKSVAALAGCVSNVQREN